MSGLAVSSDLAPPQGAEGPVFAEPWEARVFALVVEMNARGLFGWKEFQGLLVDEIAASEAADMPRPYYMNWLRAAERLFAARGFASTLDIETEVARLRPDDRTVRLPGPSGGLGKIGR